MSGGKSIMAIQNIIWLYSVEAKIIDKHNIWPEEVEEVLRGKPHIWPKKINSAAFQNPVP
jgi:hypothetical protein